MKRVEEILTQCIDDIKAGRAILVECLERYPDMRAELKPLLNVALSIKEKPDIKPSEAFKIRARANLMEHIHASQLEKKVPLPSSQPNNSFGWFTGWARAVAITVAIILVVAAAGTGTAYASQSSLPGDTLYSVKLGTEELQRIFTFDTATEVELELKFASIRLDEMDKLASMPADQVTAINSGGGKVLMMSIIGFTANESERAHITQTERIELAAAGYEKNLNMAISKSEQLKDNEALLETVALAILNHLDKFDEIEDKTSGEMVQVITSSKAAALAGYMKAVQNLASVNPVRANEINQQAIQNRLERAEGEATRGNSTEAQNALQEMEKLRQFGDEIPNQPGGENQKQGNNETNSSTQGEQQGTQGSDNGQPSQGTNSTTNPSGQGQDTLNQPKEDGQGNATVEPSETNGTDGNTRQLENTHDSLRDGTTQQGDNASETTNPAAQPVQDTSDHGLK
ncbi:MAG: DUF5667 domain-containing protein [Pedobacter sp.]|jgi:hypothetical protein